MTRFKDQKAYEDFIATATEEELIRLGLRPPKQNTKPKEDFINGVPTPDHLPQGDFISGVPTPGHLPQGDFIDGVAAPENKMTVLPKAIIRSVKSKKGKVKTFTGIDGTAYQVDGDRLDIYGEDNVYEIFNVRPELAKTKYSNKTIHTGEGSDHINFSTHPLNTTSTIFIQNEGNKSDSIAFTQRLGYLPTRLEAATEYGKNMVKLVLFEKKNAKGITTSRQEVVFEFGKVDHIQRRGPSINLKPFAELRHGDQGVGYYNTKNELLVEAPDGFDTSTLA